jgi:hypothetical protein
VEPRTDLVVRVKSINAATVLRLLSPPLAVVLAKRIATSFRPYRSDDGSRYSNSGEQYTDLEHDEYVEHLSFVVGGFLSPGNLRAFECGIRNMPGEGAIVEIGSFLGLSTTILAYARHKYHRPNPFFTCDPWVFAGRDVPKAGYFSTGSDEYRQWVMRSFRQNILLFARDIEPHTVEAFSDRFFQLWEQRAAVEDVLARPAVLGGPISLAYIDGDHSYEVARRDVTNVGKYLLPGGFLILDDSADQSDFQGLKDLVRELRADRRYELVCQCPNYCFRRK